MFGRNGDLDRVVEAFATHRLVTLTGAAGFGKTRLARACGKAMSEHQRFDRRVWFADLTACRDEDEVVCTVAEALGLVLPNRAQDGGARAQVHDYLATAPPSLLLLDNAEHLVPQIRGWLVDQLTAAPDLHVLATSREAFDLAGEQRILIGPLSLQGPKSAAVQLFVARANAVGPALDLNDESLACIGELVTRLDGNPLAIELAAARSTLFSPAQLLKRLDRRFELLSQSDSTKGGLWGAINESWEALNPDERRGLMALSLFRRGASIEAAEAMVRPSDDDDDGSALSPMNLLSTLVGKSLVVTTVSPAMPEVRRLDLYESIREFARARLRERGEEQTGLERQRAWFRALAIRLAEDAQRKEGVATARAAAAADLENLLDMFDGGLVADVDSSVYTATVDALLATRSLIQGQVPRPVTLKQLTTAMTRATELPASTRVRLTSEYGGALADGADAGGVKRAAEAFETALQEAQALGEPFLEGLVLYHSARLMDSRPPEQTIEALSRATVLLEGEEHRSIRGRAQCALGLALLLRKDYQGAKATLDSALASSTDEQSWDVRGMALNNYSLLNALLGRWSESKRQLLEALELVVLTRNTTLECVIRGNIGECCLVEGRFAEGERWMRESQSMATRCGHGRQFGMATGYLAGLIHLQGRFQEAHQGYSEALDALAKTHDDPLSQGLFLAVRALASAQLGNADDAQQDFALAQSQVELVMDPILWSAFQVYRLTGDVVSGLTPAAEARALTKQLVSEAEQLALTQPPPHRMHLVGHAQTLFEAHINPEQVVVETRKAPPVAALVLEPGARGFVLPSGENVTLGRRLQARRMITLLVQQRLDAPGTSVSVGSLFDAGWPGDPVAEPYRSNRVYVTVTRLRQSGLAPYLLHDGEGYMLDPNQPVVMA